MNNLETTPNKDPAREANAFWTWLRKLFGAYQQNSEATTPPEPRESSEEVLQRTTLPDREVALDDISIHRLDINGDAIKALGKAINKLQYTPLDAFDIHTQLREALDPRLYDGIRLVSSAIANRYDKDIPVLTPNEEEIKAMKPMLEAVSTLLRQISPKLASRFEGFITKEAGYIIRSTANRICEVLDGLSKIPNPRGQFVPEMADLYTEIATPQYETNPGFFDELFGEEGEEVEIQIERKIKWLISWLRESKYNNQGFINKRRFPLTTWLLKTSGFPPHTLNEDIAAIAGSEMTQGIETFLRRQNVRNIPPAPPPAMAFDLLDIETWIEGDIMRSLAETLAPEKLAAVRRELPNILNRIIDILPQDGPGLRNAVKTLAENILILSQRGHTGEEIAKALLAKPTTSPEHSGRTCRTF